MIKRILVALDGSMLAEQALPTASALARKTGAEVLLMTAIAPPDRWVDGGAPRLWEEEETALASRYLESIARILRDKGTPAKTRVIWGRPAEMIRVVAGQENADIIALTTHGRSGLSRWLIGSIADKLVRTADRPLLLVRAGDEPPPVSQIGRILVALDGSTLAESVLPFAKRIAQQLSASLLLERVVGLPTVFYAEQSLPSTFALLEEMKTEARVYLEGVKKRIEGEGITVETNVDDGFAVEAIVDASQRFAIDVIALCTHGRSGVSRMILGSVADGVVRRAGRPCLVIPAPIEEPRTNDTETRAPVTLGIEPPPTVIPEATITELTVANQPRKKAPAVRQHRPEGVNRRKA